MTKSAEQLDASAVDPDNRRMLAWTKSFRNSAVLQLLAASLFASPGAAQTSDPQQPTYEIPRLDGLARIDGVLDEPEWSQALVFELGYETEPGENVESPVRTECRMYYTSGHLLYGCHAFDDPAQVRARYRDRDSAPFADDVLGLVLDPFNNQESSLVFDVNPFGVQNDRRYTESNGQSDSSWDATWSSAGRIVADGFVVEVAIPFRALRFPRGLEGQVWGFNFRRYRPRDVRRRLALLPNDRQNACRSCQNALLVGLRGLQPGRDLEITPTVTALRRETTSAFGAEASEDSEAEGGLTLRWGLTPNAVLGATFNPDFSQVEADAAQLDVNQQFSLFFPERRPFFLEGADTFDTHRRIIYTRAVGDPRWGVKLAGRQGRNAFGVFAAEDEQTSLLLPGSESSSLGSIGQDSRAAALRYRRDLGRGSSLGLLMTDRSGRDYENRVAGVDGRLRLTQADTVEFLLLGSRSSYPETVREQQALPEDDLEDHLAYLRYGHEERNWTAAVGYEEVGADFRADLGFLPRVDYREAEAGGTYRWWGDADSWFTRIDVGVDLERTETLSGAPLAEELDVYAGYRGPLQSSLWFGVQRHERTVTGRTLDNDTLWAELSLRPSAVVAFGFGGQTGTGIDFGQARQGDLFELGPFLEVELGRHFRAEWRHLYRVLELDAGELPADRPTSAGRRLFEANQSELRVVYQFGLRAYLRTILQYTEVDRDPTLHAGTVAASESDLFGQLLFTYKINPLTALYLGYTGAHRGLDDGGLREVGSTVFFKVGYAWLP